MKSFWPLYRFQKVHAYIFARTVPCPDTRYHTPLVPDWHLLKPKGDKVPMVAEPVVDRNKGTWTVCMREIGRGAGQLREPPRPTYGGGKGISLFSGAMEKGVWAGRQIPADYIKAKAQAGEMKSALYAVAIKDHKGLLRFQPPEPADLRALVEAEEALRGCRARREKENIIPTEKVPVGDKTGEPYGQGTDMPLKRGEIYWTDMFSPRQLLCFGVLVEELKGLRAEIVQAEGPEMGEAVVLLLSLILNKFMNHNCSQTRWENTNAVIKGKMDRHDYAFKATFAEMAPCNAGSGLAWAVDNVLSAYEEIARLAQRSPGRPVEITLGSATSMPQLDDGSVTAVVVDPPYADNVQYAELADFFYVWLKRTQGHRRPEWFSTYLCDRDQEAVVNLSRHRDNRAGTAGKGKRDGRTAQARSQAHAFYQGLMTDTFRECRRVLRDDGPLTVMFTHKKQEAWVALFNSLIRAGFTITATWPVKTESEHSLHQARKNAAQSTVILVARKRAPGAGVGYFDSAMKAEIRKQARAAAERLRGEGLNPVDQLVGSFGPAMEVYSRYDEIRTDTGVPVGVEKAIEEASSAVSQWRVEQLADKGLQGVEPEGRFALFCWDVLGACEFRFNEAKLLGHAVGMDVEQLVTAGLVTKTGDRIEMLSARDRRRERPLEPDEMEETLFGPVLIKKKRTKKQVLKVHPNDPSFRTALDACHALALRYVEAGEGPGGVGSARALARQQRWGTDSPVVHLMEALVRAAPEAVRFDKGKKSVGARFPEFRAWHALLAPLFGKAAPEWKERLPGQPWLFVEDDAPEGDEQEELEMDGEGNGENEEEGV